MSAHVGVRLTPKFAVVLGIGVCLSATLLAWFGYLAIREWRQSSMLLAERQTTDAANRFTSALTRDMQAAQRSVLLTVDWEEFARDFWYSGMRLAASGFARFPYPESFFASSDGNESTSLVFFHRRDRPPAWMPSDSRPARFPVVVGSDPDVARLLLQRIHMDAAEGRQFSIFEIALAGTPYQVVVRLLYDDALHQHLGQLIGFTVNLEWTRQHYFRDLTAQLESTDGVGKGLTLLVTNDQGEPVAGTRVTSAGWPTSRRTFPLTFFDPLLAIAHSPADATRRYWAIEAATSGDSALAAALGGADRLMTFGGVAVGALILGLALTVRAARASVELAELRADLISSVSHELKTPLATIRAAGESLVAGRVQEEPGRREYARLMVQEANRLTRLVDNLLAFSRVTDVATTYLFEPLALEVLVEEALQRLNVRLTSGGFVVTVDVPPDVPPVVADRDSVLLMLDNLLDNAIRYADEDRRLEIRGRAAGTLVLLDVIDHGHGIPEDETARVTEKFYRARNARACGTGLGLAIANRIANDHGAQLKFQSVVGSGTTVTVTFSAAAEVVRGQSPVPTGKPEELIEDFEEAQAGPAAIGTTRRTVLNATLQLQAIELGGTVTYFEPEEARLVEARREYERQWELWTRKVNRAN